MISDKEAETVIKALYFGWCMTIGFPTAGFWSDNGSEFKNKRMDGLIIIFTFTIGFGPVSALRAMG